MIYHENDPSDYLYFVTEGEFDVTKTIYESRPEKLKKQIEGEEEKVP